MQALTATENLYQGGFGLYGDATETFVGKGSPSKKSRTNLSISVPRLPPRKQAITSPDSANTTYSPEDEPNMTVESRTPIAIATEQNPQPTLSQAPKAGQVQGDGIDQHQSMAIAGHQKHSSIVAAETPKKKKSHARKQAPGHIPRPRNA